MKLYELSQNYNNLLALMEDETIDNEIIKNALAEVEGDLGEKLDNIGKVVKSLDGDINVLKEEEERLASKRRTIEKNKANLKQYAQDCMMLAELTTIKGKLFSFRIQKNPPSIKVVNAEDIPKEYLITQEPKIDKKAILRDLKEVDIPGIEVVQGESIRMR